MSELEYLNGVRLKHTLNRMTHEMLNRYRSKNPYLIGIRNSGVPIAARMQRAAACEKLQCDLGSLDITLYRDDLETIPNPGVKPSKFTASVDGRTVILVDGLFCNGRRIRAALDALIDFGRPQRIVVAVLVRRVIHEQEPHMPIYPSIVGKTICTNKADSVLLRLTELGDKEDGVWIAKK